MPIKWKQIDKRGNSNYKDRQVVFEYAIKLYYLKSAMLLADRKFIGLNWFKYLLDKGIHFLIRIKNEDYKNLVNNP